MKFEERSGGEKRLNAGSVSDGAALRYSKAAVSRAAIANLISFAAAGAALSAISPAYAAEAGIGEENISLTQENIGDYTRQSGGKLILKPGTEDNKRHYFINQTLDLDRLTLDNAYTALTLDRGQKPSDGTDAFYSHNLEINNGRLTIRAGAPVKPAGVMPAAHSDYTQTALYFKEIPDGASTPLFRQTGGTAEIEAYSKATAMEGANFYALEGGNFHVRSDDEATALRLYYTNLETGEHNGHDVFFSQTGGESSFTAAGESTALNSNQSIEMSGGRMIIRAADKARAIMLEDADTQFIQKGGAVSIQADDESAGIITGQFRLEGGRLSLQSGGSGKAVHLTDDRLHEDFSSSGGFFSLSGGSVEISQNSADPGGYALYGDDGSRAEFGAGSLFRPVLDADAAGAPIIGRASFGSVNIAPGAQLDFGIKNAGKIKTDSELSLNFLESRENPIRGEFSQSADAYQSLCGEKLFFHYRAEKSADGKHYQMRLKPKNKEEGNGCNNGGGNETGGRENGNNNGNGGGATDPPHKPEPTPEPEPKPNLRVSDIMRGNNKRAAKALENGMNAGENPAYDAAKALYDRFYNSEQGAERKIEQGLRALSPYQATRLPALTLNAQNRFAAGAAARLPNESERSFWLAPIGARSRIKAQNSSFARLSTNYSGLNFGAAAQTEQAALTLAGEISFGDLSGGESYHANARYIFAGAHYVRPLPISADFTPELNITLSYGNSLYKQRRTDSFGTPAHAAIRQNSLLIKAAFSETYALEPYNLELAPQIGLDYGALTQSSWKERGSLLALKTGGAHYNRLSPKLGSALNWHYELISLSAAAVYRYAAAGRNVNLNTRLRGTPAVRWREKGETDSRSSLDLSLQAHYNLRRHIRFSGLYSLISQAANIEESFALFMQIIF